MNSNTGTEQDPQDLLDPQLVPCQMCCPPSWRPCSARSGGSRRQPPRMRRSCLSSWMTEEHLPMVQHLVLVSGVNWTNWSIDLVTITVFVIFMYLELNTSVFIISEMTDIELQKTNTTLRRLSDEMRSYSIERNKEREEELRGEVDRIHSEIKILQRTNEDSATISDKLSREVSVIVNIIFLNIQRSTWHRIQSSSAASCSSVEIILLSMNQFQSHFK